MKKYTYNLFPLVLILIGFLLICLSVYSAIFAIDYSELEESAGQIVGAIGFLAIGLFLITFRSRISVDEKKLLIVKEYRVFGGKLSQEIIRIPEKAYEIIIVPKKKRARGYVNAVVPFGYNLNSHDVYFALANSRVPIIKTDRKRAIKIVEFIKSSIQSDS